MAPRKSVSKTARIVALMSGAQTELRASVEAFRETARTLELYADELTPERENLHQTAVGAQAEAVRASMYALTTRAASEHFAIAAVLAADLEGGAS